MPTAELVHSYPRVGEPFELGLDGDYGKNQPLEMVRTAGYNPAGWARNGTLVVGRKIRAHKLVFFYENPGFDELLRELAMVGEVPSGQWIVAFKTAFPKTDGRGPIGIADATWIAPDGHLQFPCIGRGGDLRFHQALGTFGPRWRWIVRA